MKMLEVISEVDQLLYYIAAGLVTLAGIIISAKYILRQFTSQSGSHVETVSEALQTDPLPNNSSKKDKTLKDGEEDLADLGDLLIKSSDIELLDPETAKEYLKEEGGDADRDGPTHNSPLKKVRAKDLEEEVAKGMSPDQLMEEQRVRESQLEAIFKLMQDNKERFGVDSMDDVQSQYHLYA